MSGQSSESLSLAGDELEEAEHEEEPEEEPGSKRRRKRGGDEAPGARTRRRHEGELRGRLGQVLERLVEWLEGRGDEELAAAIREDSKAMIGGLVSLTRPLAWLRPPLLFALSVAEPLLAFGRVLRILAGRYAERRARRTAERELEEAAAAEAEAEPWEPFCSEPGCELRVPHEHTADGIVYR